MGLSELGLDFRLKPKAVSEVFQELRDAGFLKVQEILLTGDVGEVGSFIVTRSGKHYLRMMPADTVLSPSELPLDAAWPRKPPRRNTLPLIE